MDKTAAHFPFDWIRPNWPAPPWVRAVFTTRSGGVSQPPFDSFNLGSHVQDAPAAVAANRQRLAQATGAQPVYLQQVHGSDVHTIVAQCTAPVEADASCTTVAGLACTVMVADCLPVLVAHKHLPLVGAAHAGWRGLVGGRDGCGVLEKLLQHMQTLACTVAARTANAANTASTAQAGTTASVADAAPWLAWLGPCIGPTAFEVGDDVRTPFTQAHAQAAQCFVPAATAGTSSASGTSGKWLANLPQLARQRLQRLGVTDVFGNDGSAAWCTHSHPERFYSYRRASCTGRMAALVWIDTP